jgi:hypothetical protein
MEVNKQTVTSTHTPTNWSKNIPAEAVARIEKALDKFLKVMDVLNLGLALYDLGDHGYDPWQLLNGASALGHTISAFNVVLKLTEKSVQRIAFVAAIIDAATAAHKAAGAADRGDKTAAVGYVLVGAGSALTAIGIGMSIGGIEAGWTGVGLIVAVVGFLIVLLGGDSEIQLFAKHCLWGTSYKEDGGDDKWQAAPFRDWDEAKAGGLDHQITAMFNLLAGFSTDRALTEGGFKSVRVNLGMSEPTSKLYVRFDIKYGKDGKNRHQPTIIYDMDSGTLKQDKDGDRADLTNREAFAIIVSDSGRLQAVEVAGLYDASDPAYADMGFEQSCDCEVRLDLCGDGTRWIPNSGAWVPYHVWAQDDTVKDLGHHTKNSIDY